MKLYKRYYICVEPSIDSEPSASMEPLVNFEPPAFPKYWTFKPYWTNYEYQTTSMELEPTTSEELNVNIEHKEEKNIHQIALGN